MKFNSKCIYTGKVIKEGKKGKYILVHFLKEDGQTFSVVSDVDVPENVNQLDVVNVVFELIFTSKNVYVRVKKIWKD